MSSALQTERSLCNRNYKNSIYFRRNGVKSAHRRIVPAFSIQSLQKNTKVSDPNGFHKSKEQFILLYLLFGA